LATVPPSLEEIPDDVLVERAGDAALAAIEAGFATAPSAAVDVAAEFPDAGASSAPATFAAEFDLDDEQGVDMPASEDALGFADLDDFAGDEATAAAIEPDSASAEPDDGFDLAFEFATELETAPPPPAPARDPETEFADAAEAIDAAAAPGGLAELELLDLDWADAPTPPPGEDAVDEPVAPPPPVSREAFAWTLVDEDEATDDEAAPAARPTEFGIETISAAEYLSPASEPAAVAAPAATASSFTLELVPIEEAVAPQAKPEFAARDNWLDTSAPKSSAIVQKVWVLGASIGGPEAVREFLARIPKDYPALFLLAQHMGPEFVDLMAQQLAKTTALTVRTPTHGERVAHGDIVIVPLTQRLRVDREGIVVLEPAAEPQPAHSPSIDQLLRDIGDRFGAKAGAIIFSGMAEDAAEGSRHLVDRGGRVYVQDPRTCVISSMVDGVLETGVVSFTGSPLELADRLLGERGRTPA
ncbi:MAG: chemotaxis protein CheB, partial [Xanthomonadales bacterium]|nr:chemotaxis protein CheB [Xanthomonadales bacterium]